MRTILVTGSEGFIGQNLIASLRLLPELNLLTFDLKDPAETLEELLRQADFVFHLAGVNRPQDPSEFEQGNGGLTQRIVASLKATRGAPPLLITSSTQAALENPYGLSKKHAEESVFQFGRETGAPVYVFRLPNVFGKWSRPNYNSAVATFCHNVAHGLPLQISDPDRELHLVHVDDVVLAFQQALAGTADRDAEGYCSVAKTFRIKLKDLANLIQGFPATRAARTLPSMGNELSRLLYSMYLSYLPPDQFSYPLEMKHDARGWLAEFIRTPEAGQIFISTTRPGITRGNHWHHTKVEKFLVVQGEALIRFRQISGQDVIEYSVSGDHLQVVDIPPGYTHSITNVGSIDIITLFWASEPFNPARPDTHALEV